MEVVQGEERGDHGIIFKRVGPELRVVEGGFSNTVPTQALAISNKFGLTFFVHSEGFCLAKTQDLVEASRTLAESDKDCNAKDFALASVVLPSTQFLSLSEDELVVAACAEHEVHFFSVPALVKKGRQGSEDATPLLKSALILDKPPGIKMLAWNPRQRNVILMLSRGGKLTVGPFAQQDLKAVAEDVEAVDWSPDGDYLCYVTSDKKLHLCTSDLSSRSSSKLPLEMFNEAKDGGSEAYVDTLKWVHFNSIVMSCVCKDLDEEDDNSWIFVLVSNEGPIAKDLHNTKVVSFEGFFTSLDSSILPAETGPHTLANYIQPWDLLVVTSRKSVDDHISLLGWFEEHGQSEVYKFELFDDRYTPRIELQACGDDNSVVGLDVDETTLLVEIAAPNGDSGEKLKPGPVLFCMTMEGNMSLFSMARMGNKGKSTEFVKRAVELPDANEGLLSYTSELKDLDTSASEIQGTQNKSKSSMTIVEESRDKSDVTDLDRMASEIEGTQNKSKSSVAIDEKSGLESGVRVFGTKSSQSLAPMPRPETVENEQIQKQPTAIVEAANGRKAENSRELNKDRIQAGQKPSIGPRQPHIQAESHKRPESSAYVKTTNAPFLSEMEAEFLRELNKVKEMSLELDNLMEYIEGKRISQKGEVEPSFTKTYVHNIEHRTRTVYKECQSFREKLVEQRRSIVDLRDESLQVDSWRVYVQSILEQAFDVRYQELWNKQTLHPELAGMRKRILQADQSLKQQIAEVEEHLHNLELSQWQRRKQQLSSSPGVSESKKFRSMQSIYDTVNTQMAIAQQLTHRLSLLSDTLKLPAVPKEEVDSLINTSAMKLQDMVLQDHPTARTRTRLSSSGPSEFSPIRTTFKNSLQTPSKQIPPAGARSGLQDSTRRRRDSVDKLWVDVGAAKTTVKRAPPGKQFDGVSWLSSAQLKDGPVYSPKGLYSGSGARQMMTDIPAFNSSQAEEWPRQTTTNIQFDKEACSRAKDCIKLGSNDITRLQPMQQKMQQIATPATAAVSTSWPSTSVASTAQSHFPVGIQSMPQKSKTFTPSEVTERDPASTPLIAQDTTRPKDFFFGNVPNSKDVGKRELFEKSPVTRASQEKGSLSSNFQSLTTLISDLQQRAAENSLQNKAAVMQQKGPSDKMESQRSGAIWSQQSLGTRGVRTTQTASPIIGSSITPFADLQGHLTAIKPFEVNKSELKANNTTKDIDLNKGSMEGHASKLFQGFGNTGVLKSSSTASVNVVPGSLSPEQTRGFMSTVQEEPLPKSTRQAESSSVSAFTSHAQLLPLEPARQPWASSSSDSVSSSVNFLAKPSDVMPTVSLAQEASPASTQSAVALSSAAGANAQTTASLIVPSILSAKASNVLDNSVMPAAELSVLPLTSSVSTSFLHQASQGPPTLSDEEEMEEEGNSINDFESSSFAGFGLGSSSPLTSQQSTPFSLGPSPTATSQPSNPFGASPWNQSSPSTLSVPTGQLFKPASFSIPAQQLTTPPSASTLFANNLAAGAAGTFPAQGGFGSPAQPGASFGNPTQASGQQALGSALGSFGQTRQIGGAFGVSGNPSGFGLPMGGGFASAAPGGGFASAASSGGFASVASSGGFAGIAAGGGFASAATGSGFAGFAGTGVSGPASSNVSPGGFGGFGGGAFFAVGGNTNSSLFTQMRK